jgi:hypothetical protein
MEDSTVATLAHKKRVEELLTLAAEEIKERGINHDNSKLEYPEKEVFDEYTPKLGGVIYGSEEYNGFLVSLKPALEHHYANNSHHPEHYENGINGMDLFDLMELFFDWKASSERHRGGNIYHSILINKERFGISDQLEQILKNTAKNKGF